MIYRKGSKWLAYLSILGAFPRSFLPAPMIGIGTYSLVVVAGNA